jgi:hypothetical protein
MKRNLQMAKYITRSADIRKSGTSASKDDGGLVYPTMGGGVSDNSLVMMSSKRYSTTS